MSDPLNERLNKILLRVISDEFLSGGGIGNEIAFYIFDYPQQAPHIFMDVTPRLWL